MKTDTEMKRDVEAELAWDPAIRSEGIGVAVKDGVVTLSGRLETYAEKWAVEKALRRLTGIKAVALELEVKLSPDHRRSDTDVARAAEMAIQWNAGLPPDKIRVTVDKGWITLEGEVQWDYQRVNAEKALRNLTGVLGINNEISLEPKATPEDLERRIREALTRQAVREAQDMEIRVTDNVATLRGQVNSLRERQAAFGAAWSAPGIRAVVNQLTVR
ncbi:BON domain-containing protein [Aquabacterium sp. A7-Y]|uniref:BON domain-containing protein n=1 Tax=Aquabacterium sp. A7-Y TaxID=1349605 RepID=UPI00223D5DAF|nr:BON domain-containing protein [Aquabacterium sp. A7-Y]MCW7541128.1 BON domain-containing protein [Aquabacterium sp. A7-Y]